MEHDNVYVFFRPVDPEKDGAPDYRTIIPRPMSIFTVQEKIDNREYKSPSDFIEDMRQIWTNAKMYNNQTHMIHKTADILAHKFETLASCLPHNVPEPRNNALQRAVELRFARYRMSKQTHK